MTDSKGKSEVLCLVQPCYTFEKALQAKLWYSVHPICAANVRLLEPPILSGTQHIKKSNLVRPLLTAYVPCRQPHICLRTPQETL